MTRTEIADIGKQAVLDKLFEKSGYINEQPIRLKQKGECCTVQKLMLEGCDFDLVYTPLKHLGYKAVLNVLGELYASLRQPASLSVVLGLSKRFCYEDVAELWEGVLAACREHGVAQLSLELNPSVNGLAIGLAACGVQKKGVIEKLPASKNMDLICLSGHVGAAYMGLHVLEREKVSFTGTGEQPDLSKYKAVLASYLSPEIKPGIVSRFIEADALPSRGYFLTRGLGEAVIRLTRDTGLGAKIYLEKIPISSQTFAMAEEIDMDVVTAAMNGGDDYKFLFTLPIEKHDVVRKDFQDFEIIGHTARPDVGPVLVTPEGAELPIHAQGY
ncbi:MAG: thiamine-phosphate kinase [Bacteroidales bacterium]|nr:thiamine-phosphate kinase [Bacteroidales bacterium]